MKDFFRDLTEKLDHPLTLRGQGLRADCRSPPAS